MKKLLKIIGALLIGVAALGFFACADDDDDDSGPGVYMTGIDFDEQGSRQATPMGSLKILYVGDKFTPALYKTYSDGSLPQVKMAEERSHYSLYVSSGLEFGKVNANNEVECLKPGEFFVRAVWDNMFQTASDLKVTVVRPGGSSSDGSVEQVVRLGGLSGGSMASTVSVGDTVNFPTGIIAVKTDGTQIPVTIADTNAWTISVLGEDGASDGTAIATASKSTQKVTGVAPGRVLVRVSYTLDGITKSADYPLQVLAAGVSVSSLSVTSDKTELSSGGSAILTATATYSNGTREVVHASYTVSPTTGGTAGASGDKDAFVAAALDSDTDVSITGTFGGVTASAVTINVKKVVDLNAPGDFTFTFTETGAIKGPSSTGGTGGGTGGTTGGGTGGGTGGTGGTTGGGTGGTGGSTTPTKPTKPAEPEKITDRIVIHAKTAGAIWVWGGDSGSTGKDVTPTGQSSGYNDFTIQATSCNVILKRAAGGWDKLSGDINNVKAGEYWYEGSGDNLSTTNPNGGSSGGGSTGGSTGGTGGSTGGGTGGSTGGTTGGGGGGSGPVYSGDETLEGNFNQLRIYQVMVTSFIDGDPGHGYKEMWGPNNCGVGGDLEGVIKAIPYIKALGCNAIWMTPVFDSTGADGGVKLNATGYYVSDYFAIDPNFGSMQTFDQLVAEAHANGIYIILDGVFGHNGKIKKASPGGKRPAGPTSGNIYTGLDWTNSGTQEYYKEVARWWITEHKIDGWRLDQCYQVGNYGDGVHTGGHNYWYDVRLEVEKASAKNSGTWGTLGYMVGENWDGNAAHIQAQSVSPGGGSGYGLRSCFDFPSYYSLVGCFKDKKSLGDCVGYVHKNGQEKGYNHNKGYYPNVFLTNHDVPHFGNQLRPTGNDSRDAWYYGQHVAALAVVATSPNPITVYQGDEWGDMTVGYNVNTGSGNGASDNSSRTPGKTAAVSDGKLTNGGLGGGLDGSALKCAQDVAAILNARRAYPDIWKQRTQYVSGDNDFYVGKKQGSKTITFAINRSGQAKSFSASGTEVITGSAASGSVQVPAYSVRIVVSN